MTASAIFESEVAAERSFAVMTSRATLPSACRKMFRRAGRADLFPLWQARDQRVTRRAFQALPGSVFRMSKTEAKRGCTRRGSGERLLIVADTARGDFLSGGRCARGSMAKVTLAVRIQPGGNSERRASIKWFVMTGSASILRSRESCQVLRMIEFDIEALFERCWEFLQRRFCAAYT